MISRSNRGPRIFKGCYVIPGKHSCDKAGQPLNQAIYRLKFFSVPRRSFKAKVTIFAKNPASGKWSRIARRGIFIHA